MSEVRGREKTEVRDRRSEDGSQRLGKDRGQWSEVRDRMTEKQRSGKDRDRMSEVGKRQRSYG